MLKTATFQLLYLTVAIAFLTIVLLTQAHSIPSIVLKIVWLLHVILLMAVIKKKAYSGQLTTWNTFRFTYSSTMKRIALFPSKQPVYELPPYDSQMADIRNLVRKGIVSNRRRIQDDNWSNSDQGNQKRQTLAPRVSQFNQNYYDFKEVSPNRRSFNQISQFPIEEDAMRLKLRSSSRPMQFGSTNNSLVHKKTTKKQTSKDSLYEKMNITKEQRNKMLSCIRNHISELYRLTKSADISISRMTQAIFRQKFSEYDDPNCISLDTLTKIIKNYKANGTISQEHFKCSRQTINSKDTIRGMQELVRLFELRPPEVNLQNKKSLFNFYLWHIRHLFSPTKIQVVSWESACQKNQRDTKFIKECRFSQTYSFHPDQEDCQNNIEETFLFLFLDEPIKISVNIVRSLLEIKKYR